MPSIADEVAALKNELDRMRWLYAHADEKVRQEIGGLLHGRVQSRLMQAEATLSAVAKQTTDPDAAASLVTVIELLEDLRVNDIRAASHALHPPAIMGGLVASVSSLCRAVEGEFDMLVDVVSSADIRQRDQLGESEFHPVVCLIVYRILDDALLNARCHGNATEVVVSLQWVEPNSLRFTVADNGGGFDVASAPQGFGLAAAHARANDRGGSVVIESTPGHGTLMTVTLPIRDPRRHPKGQPSSAMRFDRRGGVTGHLEPEAGVAPTVR